MRYFFLAYAIIAVLFVGIMGFRGQKFHKPPIMIFPDMDNQDKLKAQAPSDFFADGVGERLPIDDTQPRGFNEEGAADIGGIPEYEFGGQVGYYYTGHVGDYFGTGMPEELELTSENAGELIRRGEERFGIYCAVCHGTSGNGLGITSEYGVPGIANLHGDPYKLPTYPDGRLYDVITNGKGQMGGYGANIPVRDRWAIVAYVRTLQVAKTLATEKAEKEAAAEEAEAKRVEEEKGDAIAPAPADPGAGADENGAAAPAGSDTEAAQPEAEAAEPEAESSNTEAPSEPSGTPEPEAGEADQ